MRNILTFVLAPLALLAAASCGGGTPEERALETLEELVVMLEGIETAEDAKAAEPKVKELGETFKEIEEEAGGEPEFTEEQKKRSDELTARMRTAITGMMNIEGAGELLMALEPTGGDE